MAGALLFNQGETAFAVVVWVLTFAGGAVLMIAAFLTRAIAAVLARLARIESDLVTLVADRGGEASRARPRDPWGGHQPPL